MTNWLNSDGVRRVSCRGARLLMAIGCACVLASCGMLGLSGAEIDKLRDDRIV